MILTNKRKPITQWGETITDNSKVKATYNLTYNQVNIILDALEYYFLYKYTENNKEVDEIIEILEKEIFDKKEG